MRSFLLVLSVVLVTSCSVQAKITVGPSGASTVEAAVTTAPATKQAWSNLRDLDSTLPADPLDAELLKKGLGKGTSVTTTGGTTNLGFIVPDPGRLFPGWVPTADVWDIVVDRATIRRLAGLTSWADSPAVDALLPAPSAKVTEAEYRDLLVYLLGPGLAAAPAGALVDGSTVQLTLVAPRDIKTADGATVSGHTATYRWPLVKVLTLNTPLRLRLTF